MSSSKSNEPGLQLQGFHGKYELLKELGRGGNGIVYSVKLIDADDSLDLSSEYVIKRLNLAQDSDEKERDKRRKRFLREINNVKQLQEKVQGVIPIYDHAVGIAEKDIGYWHLMPLARPYYFGRNHDLEKTLLNAVVIGKTIQQIHSFGRAHRDIKPSNILFYKGRPVISDFGLVWTENEVNITESGEHIGPVYIRPPELEFIHNIDIDTGDYFHSDVYMFAKTVWIFLTGNKYGFRGEYSRGNYGVYLKDVLLQPPLCLEPLNIMLERATKEEPTQRCSIEECITLLEDEVRILQNRISPQLLRQYRFEESIVECQSKIPSSENIYKEAHDIIAIVSPLEGVAHAVISEYEVDYNLGDVRSIEYFGGNNFVLRLVQKQKPGNTHSIIDLYIGIEHVSISSDKKCSIKIVKPTIFGDDIPTSSNIKAIAQTHYTQVALNAELTIRFLL